MHNHIHNKESSLSVVLAVRNEEENLGRCLKAVKDIADEIIIVDEYSTDRTVEIARSYGAKVSFEPHHDNFHITKQKAIEKATRDWILQLDADEVVTPDLADEITLVLKGKHISKKPSKLFLRHQAILKDRDNLNFETGEISAYLIPRLNMFLGHPLRYAGVYPDPAIRLIKKGRAYLPGVSVHEVMEVDGRVAWLTNDMKHYDSPTLKRYLNRANRYTSFTASLFEQQKLSKNIAVLIFYSFIKPISSFISFYLRHRGYKDGIRGFLWSLFSSWHHSLAYFKYYTKRLK